MILNDSIIEVIGRKEYKDFLKLAGWSHVLSESLEVAHAYAEKVFEQEETVRQAWNEIMWWKINCCWKEHEIGASELSILDCKNRNLLCGHPELTKVFHTVWVGWWIALNSWWKEIQHPNIILGKLKVLDLEAQNDYWTSEFSAEQTAPSMIPELKRLIKEREAMLYKEIINPYMLRVSAVLRTIS